MSPHERSNANTGVHWWRSGILALCLGLAMLTGSTACAAVEGQPDPVVVRHEVLGDPNAELTQTRPFALMVLRDRMDQALAGQRCVFPVTVLDEGIGEGTGEPVRLWVSLLGGGPSEAVVSIEPNEILPGEVAELTIVPIEANDPDPNRVGPPGDLSGLGLIIPGDPEADRSVALDLWAERGSVRRARLIKVSVLSGEDQLGDTAAHYRDLFIPWLAEHHPDLGITAQTEWMGTIVRPRILVVMYYLFFSSEWEMGVRWHVMIPPYDWAEIYLRRRSDLSSTRAWRIHSVAGGLEPEITALPTEGIFR